MKEVIKLDEWELAIQELNKMIFPATLFRERAIKGDSNMVRKNSYTHKDGKKHTGDGNRVVVPNIMRIRGFNSDAWQHYCYECKKVYKMGMVMFNNKTNTCYIREFMEDRTVTPQTSSMDFSSVFDGKVSA